MVGVFVGLLCAASWAAGSVSIRSLSQRLDPITLNAPRSLVGGLAILLFTLATGRTATYQAVTPDKLLFLMASMVVGGGLGDSFYIASLARIGVARAFPIASTYPALTLVFGLIFLRESLGLGAIVGLVLVVGGVILISRFSVRHNSTPLLFSGRASGVTLALLTSLLWAVSGVLVAPGLKGLDAIAVASFRVPALSLILWGIAACRGTLPQLRKLSGREWAILIAGGIIGWGIGGASFVSTVALVGPTRAAILTATSPLFALSFSVVLLKEKVNAAVLVGTALTVAGIVSVV